MVLGSFLFDDSSACKAKHLINEFSICAVNRYGELLIPTLIAVETDASISINVACYPCGIDIMHESSFFNGVMVAIGRANEMSHVAFVMAGSFPD